MRSSRAKLAACALYATPVTGVALAMGVALAISAADARAQQQAQGFAVERFYPAAPGGGWLVMDDLSLQGGLGGAIELTSGYAYRPLLVATTDGSQRLAVVQDQAFADVGLALTYDRYRVYANFPGPLAVSGQSGIVGGYQFTAPAVDIGNNPDTFSDCRIGFDARIFGELGAPLRLGAGAQLLVPSGTRPEYLTDDTYRAMLRVLAAGDYGMFTYAGQFGVHIRPLDEAPVPATPRGSELLYGAAAGVRVLIPAFASTALVVGPELFGETAFEGFFGSNTTDLEGLLSARVEGTGATGGQLRIKAGAGGGIDAHFGAPEFRAVVAIEVFDRNR
jgi:hypothetical protein